MSTVAQMAGNSFMISRILSTQTASINTSMKRLATGLRLNSAADGPAEMVRAVAMQTQLRSLGAATGNAQSALAVTDIAQAGYDTAQSLLTRMAELVTAAGDPTLDKTSLQAEMTALAAQLDTLSGTEVGGKVLLDGSQATTGLSFLVGPGAKAADYLTVRLGSVKAADLGVAGIDLTTATSADLTAAAAAIEAAADTVGGHSAAVGTADRVLRVRIDAMSSQAQALSDSYTALTAADMAAEMANLTKQQTMQENVMALLAHQRISTANTLRLLFG